MKITDHSWQLTSLPIDGAFKPAGASSVAGGGFKKMLQEVNTLQNQADTKAGQSLLGKEDLHEAMLSLEKANMSMKLLIQVRNKLLQAYEELSRMPL